VFVILLGNIGSFYYNFYQCLEF